MNNLDIAIKHEGSISALARALGVSPQNINNWKRRGTPHMVSRVIKKEYARQISLAEKEERKTREAAENAAQLSGGQS